MSLPAADSSQRELVSVGEEVPAPAGQSFLYTLRQENLCVRECMRFGLRHPRYLLVGLVLYSWSFPQWKASRPARMGYAFLQLFDDYMDGDRACPEDLNGVAERMQCRWEAGRFEPEGVLDRLGQSFYDALRYLPASEAAVAKADVAELLRAMHYDFQRRILRWRLSAKVLEGHLLQTFRPSLSLLLRCAGCRTPVSALPAVVAALSWCSVVRDFTDDVGNGLINIPKESIPPEVRDAEILANPQIQVWLREERRRGRGLIDACEIQIKSIALEDPRAARLLGTFARSMRKYQLD